MSLLNSNKRTKRIEDTASYNDELPEVIIQRIQSFLLEMDEKDAVRSTILSKQWRGAWLTRPNLSLNEVLFQGARTDDGFSQEFQVYATKALERYRNLNLNLDSLKLRMLMPYHDNRSPVLADQLILDALKLGANFLDVGAYFDPYELPPRVFTSLSLRKLSLLQCKFSSPTFRSAGNIVCLELVRVAIKDYMMADVLRGCPLIEKLDLQDCIGLEKVNLSVARRTLKHFSARTRTHTLYDRSTRVEFEEDEGSVRVLHEYGKLISLVLDKVTVTGLFLNYQHRFPCLETIVSQDCEFHYVEERGIARLGIFNKLLSFNKVKSLTSANMQYESINISHTAHTRFEFDERISDIKITTSTWETSMFLTIRNLLNDLSTSEISLVIDTSEARGVGDVGANDIQTATCTLPVVENLTIKTAMKMPCCPKLLCGLLWSCRPKFISAIDVYRENRSDNTLEVMHEELKKQVNKNCGLESIHAFICIHGLKEVTVEIYEESLRVWRPAPDEALERVGDGEQIRLRLKWG